MNRRSAPGSRHLPLSAWLGLVTIAISEAGMLARTEPFWTWHTPIAWTSYIFFIDGLVWTIRGDLASGYRGRLENLLLGGLACGLLWECWNYWARTKWIQAVPVPPDIKLFEMPLAGYLGFPAFGVECVVMYAFVRQWMWRGA